MEPNAVNEQVKYQHPLLRYKIWDITFQPSDSWNKWHYHREVEILLLLEGSMQVETVDRVYELHGRDLLVIGASRLHRTLRLPPVKQIVLQFDMLAQIDQYTNDNTPTLLELSEPLDRINEVIALNSDVKDAIYRLSILIYQESTERQSGFEMAISGAFKQLLALVIRHMPATSPMSQTDWQRLKPVLEFIESHYTDQIRIQDVLPLVHLEYHYFIKYFQQCIGVSFVDYLHARRIKKAEHLLLTEPLSITEIGLQAGFPSVNQFIRIFKRYNEYTPAEFRKQRLKNQEGAKPPPEG